MPSTTVELRNVAGTEAALGWAGGNTLVVDRPEGKAGGRGLGFNGAQIPALALGGCFCNDLRYAAHALGVALGEIAVEVTLELAGEPLVATAVHLEVACTTLDGSDPAVVVERARSVCTVAHTLRQGLPVEIRSAPD